MATEIELKAHVKDSESLRSLLGEKAAYQNSFEKEDSYWINDDPKARGPARIRVRKEKRVLPDGTTESACFATVKKKEVRDRIEINEELEFEIASSSGRRIEPFEDFLRLLGYKPGQSKRKLGWAFSREDICAELVNVEGLGWFIELEILTDSGRQETVNECREKLFDFLDTLGIGRDAIESRFYTEMLKY